MTRVSYVHYAGGVRVSKTPDGRGYFRVRFTKADGRPGDARRQEWADADQLARELAGLAGRRQAPAPADDRTVGDVTESWFEQASPMYRRSSGSTVRRYIVPTIGDLACAHWDDMASKQVVLAAEKAGLAESSIAQVVVVLRSIAKHAREIGALPADADPVNGLGRRRTGGTELDLTELPTAADIDRLVSTLEDRQATLVYCLAYSGLRIGEAFGLHVGDIDLEKGTLAIERQHDTAGQIRPPKYDSYRTTVYPEWLDDRYAAVVEGRAPEEPAFPGPRGGYAHYSPWHNRIWRPACRSAEWNGWTPHTLRHHFCTWALSNDGLGLDVADVSRLAGHKSTQVTWQTYVQSRPDRLVRARAASTRGGR